MFRLITKNDNADKTASVIINVGDSMTKDSTNSKAENKPIIKKLTDNPSLYSTTINTTNTMAKPVSSCNNLIINNGNPKIAAAINVFLYLTIKSFILFLLPNSTSIFSLLKNLAKAKFVANFINSAG